MLLKHWNLILIFLTFSIISCESSKNEPEVNSTPSFPVGREFNVSLNIAPFLEVAEQPLSRSTSTVADGIYAVNVFWKGDRKSTRLNSSHSSQSRMPSSA